MKDIYGFYLLNKRESRSSPWLYGTSQAENPPIWPYQLWPGNDISSVVLVNLRIRFTTSTALKWTGTKPTLQLERELCTRDTDVFLQSTITSPRFNRLDRFIPVLLDVFQRRNNYFYIPEFIKVMSSDHGLSLLYCFYIFLGFIKRVTVVAA